MFLINWFADPAGLFGRANSGVETQVAKLWLQGKHVMSANWNIDHRVLQRVYAEGLRGRKKTLVLGSSRAMGIHAGLFPRGTFFNASVSGATLNDHVAIYQLYVDRGLKPARVVLSLDPWILNANNMNDEWKSIGTEFHRGLRRLHIEELPGAGTLDQERFRKYLELISPNYFQNSLRLLLARLGGDHAVADLSGTMASVGSQIIRFADGSLECGAKDRSQTPEQVVRKAVEFARMRPVYCLGRYHELDARLRRLFETFVADLLAQGTEVVFFLPPYHPSTYATLMADKRYQIIARAEDYFRQVAAKDGISVYGSYDPAKCGMSNKDFVDGMHVVRAAASRIYSVR